MTSTQQAIKNDKQIKKFCAYGFLKNLKFFEPYLVVYLLGFDLNLFEIGLLYSLREAIMYLFEIPSGIIADHYGKKKELMMCFLFYMASFVFFFIGGSFLIFAIAMFFFGLGEAFRSGTHKAMIYGYLEKKNWFDQKTYVYGRTRSFSLVGSSISALLSIIFVLSLPSLRGLFLIGVIPYLLDFLLIASYPDYLDERRETTLSMGFVFKEGLGSLSVLKQNRQLRGLLLSSSSYDAFFRTIKDYVQPLLLILFVGSIQDQATMQVKVTLGVLYGAMNLASAFASRNVYRLTNQSSPLAWMNRLFDGFGLLIGLIALGVWIQQPIIIMIAFFLLFIMKDMRRPLFVSAAGDLIPKKQRATILSVESQLRALMLIVLAPVFGFLAQQFSLSLLFLGLGLVILIINRWLVSNMTK
ncbi:tetracycline efflux MFS transporter TetA(P) [Gottschalkiaceae bacterium SANA]|nr:tetracycline efflux MFS transporter TetA(P) [Gottschalkiaceae bacterium SANA]